MNAYAVIETGGEQLRVEPGRFYDVRHFASLNPENLGPNSKILIYRVLMICDESTINIGHPWLKGAMIKGRILHSRLDNKITVYGMRSKKKTRRKLGHRQKLIRFVVDSICSDVKDLYKQKD
uniref:Large ribosomal subunit protein bL21c n=1 Tax=Huperzia serrata f. longipetiolata TaxID=384043 RepID=A0A343R052_HUPSR|nr:ribosomal protein L21 [Huperzia crispata]YP_011031894.1 ribosomal protein L21 [Huperzia selago]YP_011031981.1 ribosomal protein L21 [Huperzia kunmingensis]ATV96619.1 ribosomal protein L21 [Huperzia serrata f. longipetiolata]WRB00918.1 ribosomal protein L21 [Huperzia sp. DW-2023a]WRB01352.1 ribosomal protein L21 [Huperzia serrata]USH59040.1 ribosomal protein L21 [Huperzia crispata]WRB00831.1 ribosomal protein L21 [Huperzia crispata]